jgi:hypothetical protein
MNGKSSCLALTMVLGCASSAPKATQPIVENASDIRSAGSTSRPVGVEARPLFFGCRCENDRRFEPDANLTSDVEMCLMSTCFAPAVCEEISREVESHCWPSFEPREPKAALEKEACERANFYFSCSDDGRPQARKVKAAPLKHE